MAAIHHSFPSPLSALAASTIPLLAGLRPLVQDLLSAKYRGKGDEAKKTIKLLPEFCTILIESRARNFLHGDIWLIYQ